MPKKVTEVLQALVTRLRADTCNEKGRIYANRRDHARIATSHLITVIEGFEELVGPIYTDDAEPIADPEASEGEDFSDDSSGP